ncbi:MAG: endonuclease MutS2 [Acutalibacteraceae bacterium]|jgi:DNA mismatch repair protein MutS2|nr:endonuclease MutS2 [Clostridiales bacterium]
MTTQNNKHYKSIELDKVLAMLANHTSCDDAKQLALELCPQSNLSLAQVLINQTSDAFDLLARFGGPSFGGLKNINNSLQLADSGATLSTRELLNIGSTLRTIRALQEWHSRCFEVKTSLDIFFSSLYPNKYLEDKIFTSILSEDEIADNASAELFDIRRKKRLQESRVREQLDKVIHSSHYQKALQESIITMRNGRFVVPVKYEHRAQVPGLVHDTSSSGSTVFIEPMSVVEANNEIKVLISKERDEIERILCEISVEAGSFADTIKSSYECAVELNLIFAKAQLGYAMKASIPVLNDKGIIDIKSARHPLIDPKSVVPIDIRLGEDFDTLVITGPNTGGKTVSIKTIGLLSLMAMCGLMIPASDNSRISVFEKVFADIGDEQSIEQSLSTFSSHMKNIINIMEQADENTLVLIDELGAGTDPIEGAALAMAIIERLHIQGAKIASTTHYAELKAYALQTNRVENACCEFDVETLRPTYRLLIGVPGRSNAFAISHRLGMDTQVVDRAKELVSTESSRFEDVVDKLEQSRRDMEQEHKQAQELNEKAKKAKEEAERIRNSIDGLKDKELEKARSQAMQIVEKARRESIAFMDEIEKLKKQAKNSKDIAEIARLAKAQVKQHENEIDDIINPIVDRTQLDDNYVLPRELVVGDVVLIADIGKQADVLSIADKKGMVEVQMGIIKTRVPIKNLRLVDKPLKSKKPKTRTVRVQQDKANLKVNTTCDLRGMTVDEGLLTLDRFIDSEIRTGLNEFTVIHGKGTGVLRKAVRQFLSKHPQVKEHRLGTFGEGEDGVSIVTLK